MKQKKFKVINTITKLNRIKKEIEDSIKYFESIYRDNDKVKCVKCNLSNLRVRIDKSYFCVSCGYDSRLKLKQYKIKEI